MIPGLKLAADDAARLAGYPWPVAIEAVEAHLRPDDPFADRARVVAAFRPLAASRVLAAHQPFRLRDGRLVDVAADDRALRAESVRALEASAELAAEMGASFLVLHPGGVRREGEADADPGLLATALAALEPAVPVLLENMPWWYHLPEGRARSTLGRTPDELAEFDDLVAGFCLDLGHAWGAEDPGGEERIREFLPLADRILHVHASDAALPDREGLPFGAGTISAAVAREVADALGPRVACVPEIHGAERAPDRTASALAWLRDAGCFRPR